MGFFFFIIPSLFCCVKHVLNIQEVKGGAEILVNYEYAFDEAPPWSVHTVLCILQQGWRQSANNLFSFFVFGLIILYEGDWGLLPELIISTTNLRHYFKRTLSVHFSVFRVIFQYSDSSQNHESRLGFEIVEISFDNFFIIVDTTRVNTISPPVPGFLCVIFHKIFSTQTESLQSFPWKKFPTSKLKMLFPGNAGTEHLVKMHSLL